MARIFVLMGRANSGKTTTIDALARYLGLRYTMRGKPFKWSGKAKDVRSNKEIDVFAEKSSPQERFDLNEVMEHIREWIRFLRNKNNAVAIIPFTLLGGDEMKELILKPLNLLKKSGNKVKAVYLERPTNQLYLINPIIDKVRPNIIKSRNKPIKQAKELREYMGITKNEL